MQSCRCDLGVELKGIVILGDGEVDVREFPDPSPGPGEVVVRTKAAAICGSDIHVYHLPKTRFENRPPVVAGHEPAGTVEAVGQGVTMVKPGDRVSVYHYIGCGKCKHCLAGMRQWCHQTQGLGSHCHGADADFVLVKEDNCCPLPDELTFVDGAFMACAAGTSYSALNKLRPNGAASLLVTGLGPVGLSGVMIGKAMGARVAAVGRREIRLRLAREAGADWVVDADDPEALKQLTALFPEGFDAAFETSGSPQAFEFVVRLLARGGRAAVVAGATRLQEFGLGAIVKQLSIIGSFVIPIWMVSEMAAFIARHKLSFDRLVTHRFAIDQAKKAFELFDSGECGKVVFEWN